MPAFHQWARLILLMLAAVGGLVNQGCGDNSHERAEAQVQRLADNLDTRTTPTGVYVRVKPEEIKEKDPWGTPIQVSYSQGGFAEMVHVRSAGPDGVFNTQDDVVAERTAANLKGIGEGIKKNVEETTANAAKGVVKGVVQGVKESIKESMPRKKQKQNQDDSDSDAPAVEKD